MKLNLVDYTKIKGDLSPNQLIRNSAIDTIVIHSSNSSFEEALDKYFDPKSRHSVHFSIDRDGTIYKIIPTGRTACHVGIISWNSRSIAIELIHTKKDKDTKHLTSEQEESFIQLLKNLISTYSINHLLGHRELKRSCSEPYHIDMDELRSRFGIKK